MNLLSFINLNQNKCCFFWPQFPRRVLQYYLVGQYYLVKWVKIAISALSLLVEDTSNTPMIRVINIKPTDKLPHFRVSLHFHFYIIFSSNGNSRGFPFYARVMKFGCKMHVSLFFICALLVAFCGERGLAADKEDEKNVSRYTHNYICNCGKLSFIECVAL